MVSRAVCQSGAQPFLLCLLLTKPPGSILQLPTEGRRAMDLAGEMGMGTCCSSANILPEVLLKNKTASAQTYSKWLSLLCPWSPPGSRHCSLPCSASPPTSPPTQYLLQQQTEREEGFAAMKCCFHCFLPFPRAICRIISLPISLATAMPSSNFHKLTMLYLSPAQNQ